MDTPSLRYAPVVFLLLLLLSSCGGGGGGGGNSGSVDKVVTKLTVRETAGISRTSTLIHNGIPLPRDANVKDAVNLSVTDETGAKIDADVEVLARWGGGLNDATKPIQWLLVTFPASVGADSTKTYHLTRGPRSNLGAKLAVTENASAVTVDTGSALFKISKNAFNVFDAVSLAGSPSNLLGGGAGGSATIDAAGKTMTALPPEVVEVERKGDLFATVKIAGHFDNPAYASVPWTYIARYTFRADSPTAELDFYYALTTDLEGTGNFTVYERSALATVDRARILLPASVGTDPAAYLSATSSSERSGPLSPGESGSVAQKLRQKMTDPPAWELQFPAQAALTGTFATAPFAALSGASGGIGVTLQKMKYYEPQKLTVAEDSLAVDLVAENQRLGPFMGAFAKMAFTAREGGADWTAARDETLATLDHPVYAWPPREAVAHSGVLDELWDGTPNAHAEKYWEQLTSVTDQTLSGVEDCGMYGFMTYGLTPRYWSGTLAGYNEFGDETETWDGYFLRGVFTDYHNAFGNVVRQFAQSGDPKLLSWLSFPAARRTLNTMILQTEDPAFFYGGWAPIGYGAYRSDGNSSHSYFDNLFSYYYLTGDKRVLDVLKPAGRNLRNAYSRDENGALIPSDQPQRSDWMGSVDRPASQHAQIYWFLGHAGDDASYLDDFRNQMERAIELNSALVAKDGKEYAFTWEKPTEKTVGGVSSAECSQTWMLNLYFMQNLWCLYREYGDVQLGKSGVTISRYFAATNRTLWDYTSKVAQGGDGTPSGEWANMMIATWTGADKGGELQSVAINANAPELNLWFSGKSTLPLVMFRAAALSNDQDAYDKAASMARHLLDTADVTQLPWGKEAALRYIRMHGAIGYLAKGIKGGQ